MARFATLKTPFQCAGLWCWDEFEFNSAVFGRVAYLAASLATLLITMSMMVEIAYAAFRILSLVGTPVLGGFRRRDVCLGSSDFSLLFVGCP